MAQDDYYYEIQLTNKQLVFYFLAGATGLILSFLAGVMVGRGVDTGNESTGPRVAQEERHGEELRPTPSPSAAGYDYSRRLEGERRDEGLERPTASPTPVTLVPVASATPTPPPATPTPTAATPAPTAATPAPTAATPAAPRPTPTPRPLPTAVPTPARVAAAPSPRPRSSPRPPRGTEGLGGFTIQVGAFKERKAAESMATRLKARGFPAYVVSPAGAPNGLFNVRVGSYPARADAERVQARLRDHEKFRPFIVKN